MNRLLIATTLMAGLSCGISFAQSTSPSSAEPSAPQGQPQSQPSNQPESQPQSQPEPQAAPPTSQTPAASQPTASQPSGSPAQPVAGTRIAPGSVIPVQLTKTIDAKKAKPGDPVIAKVTMDLKTNSGEVIVPKDAKVTGHVTEAQARTKEQKESHMSIAFDHATLKSGDVNLPMSIQAVIAPPSTDANNSGGGGGAEPSAPATGGSTASSSMGGGHSSSAGAGQTQPSTAPSAGATASDTPQQGSARPQITGNTQGVIGISNLKLEAGQNATQGSMLTSDKNNVKVESGTMLLLKVNQ